MKKHSNTIRQNDAFLWVNIVLMGMASLMIFYYVMMANSIASSNYQVKNMHDQLSVLSESNSVLMSKKMAMEIPAVLMQFAGAQNLVEAKDIVYIFENKNVAQR